MAQQAKEKEERKDVTIRYGGDQIILPDGMDYDEAVGWLKRKKQEQETEVTISEDIPVFPLDGAVALARVLERRYGWTNLIPTPGFWGDHPPQMIGVEIAYNQTAQVPWGRVVVPKISGYMETGYRMKDGMPIFVLRGKIRRKDEKIVHELANEIREFAINHSIYRSKAIKINFRNNKGERQEDFSTGFCPKFIDISRVREEELVFSEDVGRMVQTNLFNPVEHSKECRTYKVPLKRGVLLQGPFGTGKTLTAYVLAKKCVQNDWTFIYLEDPRDLDLALGFARCYQPVVIFAEDVDRAVGVDRDSAMDKILNTLDGVESKNQEIIVVLTTNDVKSIHPAFIRPGRIDSVISIQPPDPAATVQLMKLYGRDIIEGTAEELEKAVLPLAGANAAFIRETVERAKLSAIAHSDGGRLSLNPNDINVAALTMREHLKLLEPEAAKPSKAEQLGELAGDILVDKVMNRIPALLPQFAHSNGNGD